MHLDGRRAKAGFHHYLILFILVAAVALLPRMASAQPVDPWPTGWESDYMQRSSNCTGQADPINLIFYSAGYRAVSKVEEYLGWTGTGGGTMYVRDLGQCFPSDQRHGFNQRESDIISCYGEFGELCRWYHIRLWDGWGAAGSWGYYTGAGVHLDEEHWCTVAPGIKVKQHKAVDFDGPRQEVLNAFASHGYTVGYLARNNTQPSPQDCDAIDPDPQGDGWVAKIQMPPPSPTMFKAPASANLWVCTRGWPYCQGPGEGELALQEWASAVTTFDWDHDDQFDGLGRYQYDVYFDQAKVQVTSVDSGLLGSTGRGVSCGSSALSGGKRFWCASFGVGWPGPLGDDTDGSSGVLATTWVTPHPSITGQIRPAQNNGLLVSLADENCSLDDIFMFAIPGSLPSGLTPYCYDAAVTVRILEGDLNLDCILDVVDMQLIAYRYGAYWPHPLYDPRYDLEGLPEWGYLDYDIDIKDLQKVWGRIGSTCQAPIPPQPPW